MRLSELADEIIAVLASDPNSSVEISVEIHAYFPDGVSDQIRRAMSENPMSLGLRIQHGS
jgi:hypothetical protein